jgi:hypothetical protein
MRTINSIFFVSLHILTDSIQVKSESEEKIKKIVYF